MCRDPNTQVSVPDYGYCVFVLYYVGVWVWEFLCSGRQGSIPWRKLASWFRMEVLSTLGGLSYIFAWPNTLTGTTKALAVDLLRFNILRGTKTVFFNPQKIRRTSLPFLYGI